MSDHPSSCPDCRTLSCPHFARVHGCPDAGPCEPIVHFVTEEGHAKIDLAALGYNAWVVHNPYGTIIDDLVPYLSEQYPDLPVGVIAQDDDDSDILDYYVFACTTGRITAYLDGEGYVQTEGVGFEFSHLRFYTTRDDRRPHATLSDNYGYFPRSMVWYPRV